jgi:hypothetical protein
MLNNEGGFEFYVSPEDTLLRHHQELYETLNQPFVKILFDAL